MRPRTRATVLVAAALAAAYGGAAVLLPRVVDAEQFRPQVEARLARGLGRPVTLGRLELTLWSGPAVRSDGAVVGDPTARDGGEPVLEAGTIAVRPALWPLLRGTVRPRSVSVEDARLAVRGRTWLRGVTLRARLRDEPDGAARLRGRLDGEVAAVRGAPRARLSFDALLRGDRLDIESLGCELPSSRLDAKGRVSGIRDGAVRLSLLGSWRMARTAVEGTLEVERLLQKPEISFRATSSFVDFDEILAAMRGPGQARALRLPGFWSEVAAAVPEGPAPSWFLGATGGGALAAKTARLGGVQMTSLLARISLDGGSVGFEEMSFDLLGGRYRGTFRLNLSRAEIPFALRGRFEGVDAGSLLSALSGTGAHPVEGTAALDLDLTGLAGSESVARAVTGTGRAEIRDGRLASVGLLRQVATLLEMAGGRGIGREETPFDHVSAPFEVRDSRASTRRLEFRSEDLALDGGGSVGLDRSLDLVVEATFSRGASRDLVEKTPHLRFRLDPEGRLTVPLRIRGTIEEPLVQLDLDRVLQEGLNRSLGERAKRGAKRLLRRLLEGD